MFGMNFGFTRNETSPDFVKFTIVRPNSKNLQIAIHKEHSLLDLYELCYFTVYPALDRNSFPSKTTLTFAGKPTMSRLNKFTADTNKEIPVIYDIFLANNEMTKVLTIPVHKFIKISHYMQCNKEYFDNKNNVHKIFVVDEKIMHDHLYCEKKETTIQQCKRYISEKIWGNATQ